MYVVSGSLSGYFSFLLCFKDEVEEVGMTIEDAPGAAAVMVPTLRQRLGPHLALIAARLGAQP